MGTAGPDQQKALNLGVFYEDNASKKRCILKCDDPKTLAQIDGVFVTVERDGGSQKPSASLFFSHISELIRIIREHSLAPEIGKSSGESLATLRLDDQVPSSPQPYKRANVMALTQAFFGPSPSASQPSLEAQSGGLQPQPCLVRLLQYLGCGALATKQKNSPPGGPFSARRAD